MREVGAFEAKMHLSRLLDDVANGESIAMTKHGRRVALLIPVKSRSFLTKELAIAGIMSLQKKIAKRGAKFTLKEVQAWRKTGQK